MHDFLGVANRYRRVFSIGFRKFNGIFSLFGISCCVVVPGFVDRNTQSKMKNGRSCPGGAGVRAGADGARARAAEEMSGARVSEGGCEGGVGEERDDAPLLK